MMMVILMVHFNFIFQTLFFLLHPHKRPALPSFSTSPIIQNHGISPHHIAQNYRLTMEEELQLQQEEADDVEEDVHDTTIYTFLRRTSVVYAAVRPFITKIPYSDYSIRSTNAYFNLFLWMPHFTPQGDNATPIESFMVWSLYLFVRPSL